MKTQKELKEMYRNILSTEVWDTTEMVDFCTKKVSFIVELKNGDIIALDKPNIETKFCFGYSDGDDSFDRANEMASDAAKNVDFFIKENMKQVEREIERFKDKRNAFYTGISYTGQSPDSKLKSCYIRNRLDNVDPKLAPMTEEDVNSVLSGYEEVKKLFAKRLNTYLKRYGLSKVETWSYWRDE